MPDTTRTREAERRSSSWLTAQRDIERARDSVTRLAAQTGDHSLATVGDALGELAERVADGV